MGEEEEDEWREARRICTNREGGEEEAEEGEEVDK